MTDQKTLAGDLADTASKAGSQSGSSPGPAAEKAGERTEKAGPPAPETGGRGGPDPSRYGDWEINGRCVDF